MSKPLNYKCRKYCELYPCKRTVCNRKVLFTDSGATIMIESYAHHSIRNKEKYRLWRESITN